MNKLLQKLSYLKWLRIMGIEYYCLAEKTSENFFERKFGQEVKNILVENQPKIDYLTKKNQTAIHTKIMTQLKDSRNTLFEMEATSDVEKTSTDKVNINGGKQKVIEEKIPEIEEARNLAGQAQTITQLKEIVQNFEGCPLKKFAANTVFHDGVESAKIMLIGEAPGATEDQQGRPFCGESGKLLDKMLKTINLDRSENIYLTNTIFWRPPANRTPKPEEIEICRPFFEKHIALQNPSLIILVGGTATTSFLGKTETISKVRKKNYHYQNQYLNKPIITMAIFHPAFLLRQPTKKKDTWYDLLAIQDYIKQHNIL